MIARAHRIRTRKLRNISMMHARTCINSHKNTLATDTYHDRMVRTKMIARRASAVRPRLAPALVAFYASQMKSSQTLGVYLLKFH